ncbi:MAG: hypothetical protein R3E95_17155 [Thiolinea sp.]
MGERDIISKQALRRLAVDIANLLLDLNVDPDNVELLETEQQRVELRRADMVVRLQEADTGNPFILHLEIQNDNHRQMPLRMLRYYTDIQFGWPQEEVRQYLLYIGSDKLRMASTLKTPNLEYHYQILDIHTVDCEILLRRDDPDALVLAILCDFRGRNPQDVVNYIVKRLHELLKDDSAGFRNYFTMLEILSENRDLQTEIDEVKTMLTQINIEKLPSFRWGIEQGLLQGEQNERLRLARQLLDVLDDQTIAEKTGLHLDEVIQLRNENDRTHKND